MKLKVYYFEASVNLVNFRNPIKINYLTEISGKELKDTDKIESELNILKLEKSSMKGHAYILGKDINRVKSIITNLIVSSVIELFEEFLFGPTVISETEEEILEPIQIPKIFKMKKEKKLKKF